MVLPARRPEPRVAVIEGRTTLIVERRSPLPRTLEALRREMVVSWETRVTRHGARAACISDQDHRLVPLMVGRHVELDAVVRDLRLSMCQDCEAVEVRDITYDSRPRLPTGGQALRRRAHIIGWYSGARPGQRQYC
jgi:hypothetical protein